MSTAPAPTNASPNSSPPSALQHGAQSLLLRCSTCIPQSPASRKPDQTRVSCFLGTPICHLVKSGPDLYTRPNPDTRQPRSKKRHTLRYTQRGTLRHPILLANPTQPLVSLSSVYEVPTLSYAYGTVRRLWSRFHTHTQLVGLPTPALSPIQTLRTRSA